MNSLLQVPEALRLMFRHLAMYGPLVASAAGEWRQSLRRRALLLAMAACSALAATIVGSMWLVMSVWTQELHHWLLGALVAALAITAVLLATTSVRRQLAGPGTARLRYELAQDQALLDELQREASR